MGVMYEYFAAKSDEVAAEFVDDGPGGPLPAAPALQEALRTGDRDAIRRARRPKVRIGPSGVLALATRGIHPVIQMADLESLLTGETYDDIATRPRCGRLLAERNGGGKLVETLTDELQIALAAAGTEKLLAVAVPWSQTEDFRGQGDPEVLSHFLLELADLARQATQRGERLYCWSCL